MLLLKVLFLKNCFVPSSFLSFKYRRKSIVSFVFTYASIYFVICRLPTLRMWSTFECTETFDKISESYSGPYDTWDGDKFGDMSSFPHLGQCHIPCVCRRVEYRVQLYKTTIMLYLIISFNEIITIEGQEHLYQFRNGIPYEQLNWTRVCERAPHVRSISGCLIKFKFVNLSPMPIPQ